MAKNRFDTPIASVKFANVEVKPREKDHVPTLPGKSVARTFKALYHRARLSLENGKESLKAFARRLVKENVSDCELAKSWLSNKAADAHNPPKHTGRTNRIKKKG